MKIAMPYQDGVLLEHFGRAKEFIIYNVSDLDPVTSEVIAPEDLSHAAVARALKEHGVDVVLCGSIGEHARQAVEGEHMLVFSGITGAADDVLERFLQGNLEAADGDFAAGGGCGGCGGGCASGGCAGCSGCGGGAEREPYVETRTFTDIVTLTSENFQTEVLDDPGLILIDFWAEWCQPCRMLAPAFEELNREEPQVKFCRVNVDEQGELAQMFGIESIPTLAVVQDRHTLTGSVGLRSKEEIKAIEEEYAKTETPVVSNNSAHRWTPDVPMVVPEINPEHFDVIQYQKKRLGTTKGFIAVKPNCSIQSYAPVLTAWKEFEPYEVVATTLLLGFAHPQRRTSLCCWIIMLSPTRCDNFTFACAPRVSPASTINERNLLFIVVMICCFGSAKIQTFQ